MNPVKLNSEKFFFKYTYLFSIFSCFFFISTFAQNKKILSEEQEQSQNQEIITGAEQINTYLPLLKDKKVGIVTNQTGIIIKETRITGNPNDNRPTAVITSIISIVDLLIENNIKIEKIYSPEHGFRGNADAGEQVKNGKDIKTGVDIISLYGNNKKPTSEQLKNIDIILFDLQDVGVRFYTYISTLHYVMEATAENNIPVIVLDRPNPNGHYVDGPVLEKNFRSFVGMHQVPVVYGMTIGEYAQMINGEKWLKNGIHCNLTVIPLQNYTHNSKYSLPVFPSPNLKTQTAINLYPSLCFFEGTNVSEGRGTNSPFELYGSPFLKNQDFTFTPQPNAGAKNPRYKGTLCKGENLRNTEYLSKINLTWLIKAYKNNTKEPFFNSNLFFDKLAGTDKLRKQIIAGKSEEEIKKTWEKDLEKFKEIRSKYLLYQ